MNARKLPPNTPKCLIVDDNKDWLNMIQDLVNNPRLVVCDDPRKVVQLLLKDPTFEMLITDTNMPHKNGVELIEKVRSHSELQRLTVILLFSGLNGCHLTRQDLMDKGASLVISKDEFLRQLKNLLAPLLKVKPHQ